MKWIDTRSQSASAAACLALALLLQPLPVLAQESAAEAMARAIARMMESMGFNADATVPAAATLPPVAPHMPLNPMEMSSWPFGYGQSPAAAAANPSAAAAQGAQSMGQMLDRFSQPGSSAASGAGTGAAPWGGSPLGGVWEDNQGGLLIVQGGAYRLYSQCDGFIEGRIQVTGNQVELTNAREGFSQSFEMASDQGRLALRDQNGQVFLYRRLVLDGGLSAR